LDWSQFIWGVVVVVLCLSAVALLVTTLLATNFTIPVALSAGILLWVTLMWLFGRIPDWGPFTHYPFWLVLLALIIFVVIVLFMEFGLIELLSWIAFGILVLALAVFGFSNLDFHQDHAKTAKRPSPSSSSSSSSTSSSSSSTSTSTSTSTTSTTLLSNYCSGKHQVVLDPNQYHRFLSNGVKSLTSERLRLEIAAFNAHDPRGLMAYYNTSPLGKQTPIKSTAELTEHGAPLKNGDCYSKVGVKKYNDWLILWRVAMINPVSQMPAGWTNTGVNGNTPTSGPPPQGNTAGFLVTYQGANGKPSGQVGVMKRCGNLVVPPSQPPPHIPKGPTEQKPKQPTTPARTPKCQAHPFPQICGTPDSGPEQQPVGEHPQAPTPGYPGRGHLEQVTASQPVGSPNPRRPIPRTPAGRNSGSAHGAPAGGDVSTGEVNHDAQGTSAPEQTEGSGQTSSGTVPAP
jgi:hypothetical protein